MAGLSGLMSRIKKCEKVFNFLNRTPKQSIVYMDGAGNLLIKNGVEYNDNVLVVPEPLTIEEWERRNISM